MRFISLAVLAIACSSGAKHDDPVTMPSSGSAQAKAQVHIATDKGPLAVDVEVVSTEADIERGLMFREHLDPDAGMLFLLGHDKDWAFWMHNTLIPLDMIFIRRDMTIAGVVQNAEPKTDTLRKVGEPSLYVLEVNGGYCAAHRVAADQKVWFDNVDPR
ncbi:MAG: DUF192 domain-containing protein [Acidobacteriota bacterium]